MLNLEQCLKELRKEIIDYVERNNITTFKLTGGIFDRVAHFLTGELPYGSSIDKVHQVLTSAIVCSLWCGWFSQDMAGAQDPDFKYANFRREYVEDFRNIINGAFEIGREYSAVRS